MSLATVRPDLDDYAWMIGEDAKPANLSPQAAYLRETRILAAIFRRRARLIIAWRQQSLAVKRARVVIQPDRRLQHLEVICDLPDTAPPLHLELAIWRSFLAREIHDILFGND